MATNFDDTQINYDDMIYSFDGMKILFKLVKLYGKYYNEYKQPQKQSKYITKTKVTTCNRLPTITE